MDAILERCCGLDVHQLMPALGRGDVQATMRVLAKRKVLAFLRANACSKQFYANAHGRPP